MNIPSVFLKNSKGEPDGMWTLTAVSFIGAQVAVFAMPGSASPALTLFSAAAAGYFGRKHSDRPRTGPHAAGSGATREDLRG